jgi:hypothetical protein
MTDSDTQLKKSDKDLQSKLSNYEKDIKEGQSTILDSSKGKTRP